METLENKIRIKQIQINVEQDPQRKQELRKQLRKLQFEKEIDQIKKKIEQLG